MEFYGADFEVLKFLSSDVLQNLMQKQHKLIHFIVKYAVPKPNGQFLKLKTT